MKSKFLASAALAAAASLAMVGCGSTATPAATGDNTTSATAGASGPITVGFVAVGPEGGWRTANENNIKDSFSTANGFELKYAPSNNGDQSSQITAFNSFIDQGVDAILLSATEATGWETPLKRAADAEIPVVLLDRGIEPDDSSLYTARIAPDNVGISKKAAEWAVTQFPDGTEYAVLEGPGRLSVVNDRNKGWDEVMASNTGFKKVAAQSANWSKDEGKSVTETLLKANPGIKLIFAQNDEMGLGAAQAVTESGKKPGTDVKIITIDGTKAALEALAKGQLSFVAEYNPLFGDVATEVVKKALAGETVDKLYTVESTTFDSPEAAKEALPSRKY